MLKSFAIVFCFLLLLESDVALADSCGPHCDYWHYYGPSDFSYIRPGLLGYPLCDRQGNCAPHLVYTYPGRPRITITVHPRGTAKGQQP